MRRSAPRGARHARTLPDRGGRRSTRAADAAEDRGEAGAPSRGISGEGHAQRQQDRPHHRVRQGARAGVSGTQERVEIKAPSGRVRSEEHTSELQSLMRISYAVFCLKKKNKQQEEPIYTNTT